MLNFNYLIPTEIIFGKGQISSLVGRIRNYERILFVWGLKFYSISLNNDSKI